MSLNLSVTHTSRHQASLTFTAVQVSKLFVAIRNLAFLNFSKLSLVSFCFLSLFACTVTFTVVCGPDLISIFILSHLNPAFTNGADDYEQLVSIIVNRAFVICGSSMWATVKITATLTLKRHEITLAAPTHVTVLAYFVF